MANGASIDTLMKCPEVRCSKEAMDGTGIEILLPANTYAIAMNFTMIGSSFSTYYEAVGSHNVNGTNYSTNIAGAGSSQFFAITSTTPLSQIFIGPNSSADACKIMILKSAKSPTPRFRPAYRSGLDRGTAAPPSDAEASKRQLLVQNSLECGSHQDRQLLAHQALFGIRRQRHAERFASRADFE